MNLKARLVGIYGVLAVLNFGAWIWALATFHDSPALLGIALLVYGLGLRHAVDADHIAAIDNVTRKLIGVNERPVSVGFFFALGHSAVVILVAGAVAAAATTFGALQAFGEVGGTISTAVSAVFLFAIAVMNGIVSLSVWRNYRRVRCGEAYRSDDLDLLLEDNRGIVTRILRPLFRLISKSWHMFPLGFVFGLSFDTATEVTMFGLSAAQATNGAPYRVILIFPVLFTAGMSLLDTTDGVLMLRAYEWALVEPARKLRYNLTITLGSALIAIAIGVIEVMNLAAEKLEIFSGLREQAGRIGENVNGIGILIVGTCLAGRAVSYLNHRFRPLSLMSSATGRRT